MTDDSCKIIEKCIKDMIFSSPDPCNHEDVEEHLLGTKSVSVNAANISKNFLVPGNKKFVSDIEAKLLASSYKTDENAHICDFPQIQSAPQVNFNHEHFKYDKPLSDLTDKDNIFLNTHEYASFGRDLRQKDSEVSLLSLSTASQVLPEVHKQQILLSPNVSCLKPFASQCDTKRLDTYPELSESLGSEAQRIFDDKVSPRRDEIFARLPSERISIQDPERNLQKEEKPKKKKKNEKKKKTLKATSFSQKLYNKAESSSLSEVEGIDCFSRREKKNSNQASPVKASILQEKRIIKVNNQVLPLWLRESFISRKEAKPSSYCFVCEQQISDILDTDKHYSSGNHDAHVKEKEAESLLHTLPQPLPGQVRSIATLLKNVANKFGLSEADVQCRRNVVEQLQKIIKCHVPECYLELVGSSGTGFGLKESEVDIVLKVPKNKNAADMLFIIFEVLEQDSSVKDVRSEFRKKIPQINFMYIECSLMCNICIDNGTICEITQLLKCYFELDSRVSVLGICFRYWAKLCEVDQQDKGTLPAFCYPLMLIYFLQQSDPPILPVLQETSENLSLNEILEGAKNWSRKNSTGIGELWIKLLRYYSIEYEGGRDVISIRSSKKLSCEDKNWGTRLIAIEDPIALRNLAHIIPNPRVFRYIHNCFLRSYSYFGNPQVSSGPLKLVSKQKSNLSVIDNKNRFENETHFYSPKLEDKTGASELPNMSSFREEMDPDLQVEAVLSAISNLPLEGISTDDKEFFEIIPLTSIIQKDYFWDLQGRESISEEDMNYSFLIQHLKKDESAPLVCCFCQRLGHLKKACPDEILPDITPLPPMNRHFKNTLDAVCEEIMSENEPSIEEQHQRNCDMIELQNAIRELFPDAVLEMFGSFCNGFGFSSSDMDLCLTFKGNKTGEGLNFVDIIENLAAKLSKNVKLEYVTAITTAKVPIVKFVFKNSKLEGDISLYNTLAQHNTRMLDAYCRIDRRVKVLGYTLKYFAKVLRIGDASRGSLSSYAYILMVIFFLQQRQPPVIPVLQELYHNKKPVVMVDGWNAWFADNIEDLPHIWPNWGKNTESVGELWLGLLCFYTEYFDSNEYVVCIRQKQLLTRFRKLWNSTSIAIEDPFDLQHNLGSGLSRRMNNYIKKAFIRGRKIFGTPTSKFTNGMTEKDHLFHRYVLCDGQEPPNDRGCRFCGKIGHMVRECPRKFQTKLNQRKMRNKSKSTPIPTPTPSDANAFQGNKPISAVGKGHVVKRENFISNPGKNKNQRNFPKNSNSVKIEPSPHRIQHLFSTQRFPPPNFSVKPTQPAVTRHPPPFTIQSHSTTAHRPATSVPFPVGNNLPHLMTNSMRNSQNYAIAGSYGRLPHPPDHSFDKHSQDSMRHFECAATQNSLPSETEQRLVRSGSHQGNTHVSHHPSSAIMFPSGHPLNSPRDFHYHSERW